MQAARSKPPDSSTDASAAFQATACTLPPWCVSVWSHAPVVRSHTCAKMNIGFRVLVSHAWMVRQRLVARPRRQVPPLRGHISGVQVLGLHGEGVGTP